MAAEFVVPHHAPRQADVSGRQHPLPLAAIFFPQAGVDFIYAVPGQNLRQNRIQRVDALDDAHTALQLQVLPLRQAALRGEVEDGQVRASLAHQFAQAAVDLIQIQRGHIFIVLGAVGQARVLIQILIEIVQADHLAGAAAHGERIGNFVGRGGFAGGRRPRQHHNAAAGLQNFTGSSKNSAFILNFAMGNKALGAGGSRIDQADLNQTFGNPDSGHRTHQFLSYAPESHQIH